MKRIGYTLTETLVAMAVIAVVAVICAPLVNSFRPDEYKAKFLSIYDAIVESTTIMATNRRLYPIEEEIHINAPLLNTNDVTLDDGKTYGGLNKYCKLLAMAMGNGEEDNCSEDNFSAFLNTYRDKLKEEISFTSSNGVDFYVGTNIVKENYNDNIVSFQINVLFDVDGVGTGKDCFFTKNACTHPDRFAITIAANGNVEIADAKGRIHIKKRNSLRLNKSKDEYDDIDDIDDINSQDEFDVTNSLRTLKSIRDLY